jgi:hypothetical protein
MTKLSKTFIKRGIVFVILLVILHSIVNITTASVGPTITDTVALAQMQDTDAGHIQMRAYHTATNGIISYIPVAISIVLGIGLFTGPFVKLFSKEEKEKKEKPACEN